jgi:hypothetical protein
MALSNTPLISSPDYNRDYILYISASAVSIAGVLIQIGDNNREHVIYYISKNLSGPPLKYNHEEKPDLAVILIVQKLHHYIFLHTTKVIADSNPMQYFLSCQQINGKFAQWIVILQEYNLEFSTPKRKKSLILTELVTSFPSDATSAPINIDFPDEHLFYITSDDLGTATSSSTFEPKSSVTTSHEMIVAISAIRPPSISSSEISYIGEGSTPYSVDA